MSELNFVKRFENNKNEQQILLNLLRAYAIAKKGNFKLPSVLYLDEIGVQVNKSRSQAKNLADEYIKKHYKVKNFDVKTSVSPKLGMFNATCDLGKVVNLNNIKSSVERDGFSEKTINGYKIIATSFTMLYGRFKKSYEYTQEYGGHPINNETPTTVQFKMKITKDGVSQGASLNIYKSGRIRFSGGYFTGRPSEVKLTLKYISESFLNIPNDIEIAINNNTISLKTNAKINILLTYIIFSETKDLVSFDGYKLKSVFEPYRDRFIGKTKKDSPFLYINFKKEDDKFSLIVSKPGSLIIEGATNVQSSLNSTAKFLTALKNSGLIQQINKPNLNVNPKPTKLARRLIMKPAPEITRRGTSCPIPRRPSPYGFQGECSSQLKGKHYVRPNPQGQPCCYKVPKSTVYSQQKVENKYKRSNVKVPESVRKTFGFGANTNRKANNIGRSNMNFNIYFNRSTGRNKMNPVGLKIGSRQCLRYSKVALVDIARRKGLTLPKKLTKPILCDILSRHVSSTPSPNRKGKVAQ
jgi:TATA-box binding protein (TBP) (component of TFIID and TFIIIB)